MFITVIAAFAAMSSSDISLRVNSETTASTVNVDMRLEVIMLNEMTVYSNSDTQRKLD